jgi:lysophospholipase L1-like esterase
LGNDLVRGTIKTIAAAVSIGLMVWGIKAPSDAQEQQLPHINDLPQPFLIDRKGLSPDLVVEELDLSFLSRSSARPLPAIVVGHIIPLRAADHPDVSSGFRHQWPAVYVSARFSGDQIVVAFDDPINRYRIELDEGVGPVVQIVKPMGQAFLLSNLGPGPHTIRVDKVSESPSSAGVFRGFYLPPGGAVLAPPERKERQVEFIGDSDTVGLGNMSVTHDCEKYDIFLEATDTQQAFGPRVAAHFRADYEVVAASGISLVGSDGASSGQSMLELYPPTTYEAGETAGREHWSPDLVVVLIGSNDWVTQRRLWGLWQTGELPASFQGGYVHFLQVIRAKYPDALILVLTLEEYGPAFETAHREVVRVRRSEGDVRIDILSLPKLERTACAWHPSMTDHQRIADILIGFIERRSDVW